MTATGTLDFDQQIQAPEFTADPYPVYAAMRREAPVFFSNHWQAWLVTCYPDVVSVLKNHQQFSNAGRQAHLLDLLPPEEQHRLEPLREHYASGGLINTDRPAHARLRTLVAKAFSPRIMRSIEPLVSEVAQDLIDCLKEGEETDLISILAFPLPAIVIAGLLGVPVDMRNQFKLWSVAANVFTGSGRPTLQEALSAQESILALKAYLSGLLDDRRERPQDDLLSQLAVVREGKDQLDREEIVATCCTLLMAGHETTTTLIGNAVYALLRNPDRLAELRSDSDLMPAAVEEFLRYDSPVQRVKRVALEDFAIKGTKIAAGSLVYAMIGSGNRDATVFPCPDRLDFSRDNRGHIAFGSGIHFCLGAALARIEARICLGALMKRFPVWNWNGEQGLAWIQDSGLRGLQRLPVQFSTQP